MKRKIIFHETEHRENKNINKHRLTGHDLMCDRFYNKF